MWDSGLLVVVALAIGFIVWGLALLAYAVRRRDRIASRSLPAVGMSIGMVLGAGLGTVVWLSTGEFVFWVIFMGAGMTLGLAIGAGRASRAS